MKLLRYISIVVCMLVAGNVAGANKWRVDIDRDKFTDETVTSALVFGGADGFIFLTCYGDGSFQGKIGAGKYIGEMSIHDNVKYRVDKMAAVEATFEPTSKDFVFFNDINDNFVQQLINGKDKVIIQLTSYDYDKSSAEFTLRGAKSAIEQVIRACQK